MYISYLADIETSGVTQDGAPCIVDGRTKERRAWATLSYCSE